MNCHQTYFDDIRNIPHFHLIRSVESRLLSAYLATSPPPFLDLGCGDGEFSRSLKLKNLFGIDIDKHALDRLKRDGYYMEVQNARASAIPYADDFFGTVFSNCAVEHMDEIGTVLKEVNRVLKKGGEFVFTVPSLEFIEYVKSDTLLRLAKLSTDEMIHQYNSYHHHVNIFSVQEWIVLCNDAGFTMQEYTPYLPGGFGRFVVRLDMLYSIDRPFAKKFISKLECFYYSFFGFLFRARLRQYINNPFAANSGTHLIIKVKK